MGTEKKYILTDEARVIMKSLDGTPNDVLYRIKALRDFGDVKKGDLGGWIRREENLSHEGDCWVYDDAMVSGNARIYGDATVEDSARISGDAIIFDTASVGGEVRIRNRVNVYGNTVITGTTCIYGEVEIYGEAMITGINTIFGDAKICGFAHITGQNRIGAGANIINDNDYITIGPMGSRNDHTTFYRTQNNDIWVCCGCFNDSITEFVKAVKIHHTIDAYGMCYLEIVDLVKSLTKDAYGMCYLEIVDQVKSLTNRLWNEHTDK